ncbi:MAG TPA: hypothetical protein VGL22_12340 [Terracidiphilus sp.]|jgi:hypothetical protein
MKGKVLAFSFAAAMLSGSLWASDAKSPSSALTAAEIADRNFAARGGVQAWHAVQSLSESGRLTAGGDQRGTAQLPEAPGTKKPVNLKAITAQGRLKEEAQLPFTLKMERGRKSRYEIQFAGKTAIQVYNGSQGWKLRPFLNRVQVEPYTAEELKSAALQPDLDGPLMNYTEKGTRIELDGQEKVEGRDTYKLKLTARDNHVTHVWIDAQTYLEAKIDGQPRRMDGKEHEVEIYFRDYRDVNGLKLPFLMETHVLPLAPEKGQKRSAASYSAEKIFIERAVVNPTLNDKEFEKPTMQAAAVHP